MSQSKRILHATDFPSFSFFSFLIIHVAGLHRSTAPRTRPEAERFLSSFICRKAFDGMNCWTPQHRLEGVSTHKDQFGEDQSGQDITKEISLTAQRRARRKDSFEHRWISGT